MQALFLKIFRPAQPTAIRTSGWPDYSSAHGQFIKAAAAQSAPLARLIFYFMNKTLRSWNRKYTALRASTHAAYLRFHGKTKPYNYIDAIVGQKVAVFLFFRCKGFRCKKLLPVPGLWPAPALPPSLCLRTSVHPSHFPVSGFPFRPRGGFPRGYGSYDVKIHFR